MTDQSRPDQQPSITRIMRTASVLSEVMQERTRQFELWGDQDFPFHHPSDGRGVPLTGRAYGAWAVMYQAECDRRRNDARPPGGGSADTRSNALVLLEEVFEALAETDPVKIREELVQVAAVAVKAIETLDRRRDAGDDRLMTALIGRPVKDHPLPDMVKYPRHDHGDGPLPCKCGATGQAARCTMPESHNAGCPCPPEDDETFRRLHETTPPAPEGPDDWPTATGPAGKFMEQIAHAPSPNTPGDAQPWALGPMAFPHRWGGAGRLHGLCRCGETADAPIHQVGDES